MTPGEARRIIYKRLGQRYTIDPGTLNLNTDFTFDNDSFKEPGDGNWVRCAVRHSVREQTTLGKIGNRRFKSEGIILCQVFVPTGIITQEVDDLALIGADAFITEKKANEDAISDIYFRGSTIKEGPADGKWFMLLVETPFSYYDKK